MSGPPAPARRPRPLIVAPLGLEALVIRSAGSGLRVLHSGMGPRRSRRAAARIADLQARPLLVMGFAGALTDTLAPGSLLLAEKILPPEGPEIPCGARDAVAELLRAAGLDFAVGALASQPRIVRGAQRSELAARGAVAVDMEAAWLAAGAERELAVLRVIVDTPARELGRPLATIAGGMRAVSALRGAARALAGLRDDPVGR